MVQVINFSKRKKCRGEKRKNRENKVVYYEIFLYLFYSLTLQHRITQRTSFSAKADKIKQR